MLEKIEWYREVLELEPSSKLFFPLARLLVQLERTDEAIAALRQGLERHPEFIEARLYLVELLFREENIAECEGHLSRLTGVFTHYPGFWEAWGACLDKDGQSRDLPLAISFLAAMFQNDGLSLGKVMEQGLKEFLGRKSAGAGNGSVAVPLKCKTPAPEPAAEEEESGAVAVPLKPKSAAPAPDSAPEPEVAPEPESEPKPAPAANSAPAPAANSAPAPAANSAPAPEPKPAPNSAAEAALASFDDEDSIPALAANAPLDAQLLEELEAAYAAEEPFAEESFAEEPAFEAAEVENEAPLAVIGETALDGGTLPWEPVWTVAPGAAEDEGAALATPAEAVEEEALVVPAEAIAEEALIMSAEAEEGGAAIFSSDTGPLRLMVQNGLCDASGYEDPEFEEEAAEEDAGEDAEEQFSLRTRSMAEVLAEQGDISGALEIYTELLSSAASAEEKTDLQTRITTLSSRLGRPSDASGADNASGTPTPGKHRLITMLETLADRLEARAQS